MIKANRKETRSKLIIDLRTQGQIIRMAAMHWIIFCVTSVALAVFVHYCSNPFAGVYANFINGLKSFAPVVFVAVCLCPVFVYDFLKLSNRIFGPVPRFHSMIKTMRAGEEVEPLQTRKDDIHADLIADVNGLIALVSEGRKALRSRDKVEASETDPLSQIQAELAGLRDAIPHDNSGEPQDQGEQQSKINSTTSPQVDSERLKV